MTEKRLRRLERVTRQYRTNEGAAKALRVPTDVLVRMCRERGIETPAVWHRRLKQVFRDMASR